MSTQVGVADRSAALPVVLTPMLGRECETAALQALLRDPAVRLVTITGPGGVGKTRLAIGAVGDLTGEVEVVFVPLAAIREPERIVPALRQAIGLGQHAGEDGEAELVGALAERSTLIVLDNLEQIPRVAPVLARLIGLVPRMTILATSQVAVEVPGERLFPLAPLPVPEASDPEALASDAVTLFLQRARAVDPLLADDAGTLEAIADICRRLDGLPLAIELAAARANLLSPRALRDRLDNRFAMLASPRGNRDDRHRTLHAAIAWTYDLLDPVEQALFRRLAVFAGGVPVDGAEAVFTPTDDRNVGEVLQSLAQRSMLQPAAGHEGATRFLMLESLRAFGLDQLRRGGDEDDARLAHARWIASLADDAAPKLASAEQVSWLGRMETDLENVRAAVAWSLAQQHHELAARIVSALWQFLANRGQILDARAWLSASLAGGAVVAPEVRSRALVAAGSLAAMHRDTPQATHLLEQARHLAMAIGAAIDEIRACRGLGIIALNEGEFEQATALLHHSQARAEEVGFQRGVADAQGSLGNVAYHQGRYADAMELFEQSMRFYASAGDAMMEAKTLSNLAAVKILGRRGEGASDPSEIDRLDEAESYLQRALALQESINNRNEMTWTLMNLGAVAVARKDRAGARRYLTEARELLRETGDRVHQAVATQRLAMLTNDENDSAGAASLLLETLDLLGDTTEPYRLLEVVEVLAEVARGRHEEVVTLLAAARKVREDHGVKTRVLDPNDLAEFEAEARAALGDEAFGMAWEAGHALDIDAMKTRARVIARRIVGRQVGEPEIAWPAGDGPAGDQPVPDYGLTAREMEVLRLLRTGKTTQEISGDLVVSPRTVSTHIANILAKLDVTSRTAAVAVALRDGVIRADP